jgi:predicted dehydrogenase
MEKINWGIIGCGDVTEIKSGPAFNKARDSALVAVMRRDAAKAEDYARRHNVPTWYADADSLINDPNVKAIYIATPPSSHEEFTLAALRAGKPAYVEKPMALNAASANTMVNAAKATGGKLVVAHYRRGQPFFKKIKELIDEKAVGDIRFVRLDFYKRSLTKDELKTQGISWRVDPSISGGGLFHDLAPHQLDLIFYFFGDAEIVSGFGLNQEKTYAADDLVTANILFKNGVVFNGLWCFNTNEADEKDTCEIVGAKGNIRFTVFGEQKIFLKVDGKTETFLFDPLPHVQQPMIEEVVSYFLGRGLNPCSAEEGAKVMEAMDKIIGK